MKINFIPEDRLTGFTKKLFPDGSYFKWGNSSQDYFQVLSWKSDSRKEYCSVIRISTSEIMDLVETNYHSYQRIYPLEFTFKDTP